MALVLNSLESAAGTLLSAPTSTLRPVRRCLYCEEVLTIPATRGRGRPPRYCERRCREAADAARFGAREDTLALNTKSKGNIALAAAITYFVSHAYAVFLPLGDNGGAIDMIVSRDGVHTQRVQCKYTRIRQRYETRYQVQLASRSRNHTMIRYTEHSFDLLFVQTPVKSFLIPWDALWRLYEGKIPINLLLGSKMAPYALDESLALPSLKSDGLA
jgi:hypothetical protein